jgi:hypothetical protein
VVAEQGAVIHPRWADDSPRIEEARGVEAVLHRLEGGNDPVAEHHPVELGADDAVAMLAGMAALVLAHHREGLLGDRAHP